MAPEGELEKKVDFFVTDSLPKYLEAMNKRLEAN